MRLIDADELLNSTIYNPLHAPYITMQDVINALTINGTVDVVQVVRCKDCKWWTDERKHENGECYCYKIDQWTAPQFYCADGEEIGCEKDV